PGSTTAPEPAQEHAATTVLDTVLDQLAGHGTPAHQVWLPPLTESPTLDELLGTGHGKLAVPIGLVDRPLDQRREPLVVELTGAAGNVAIVGAPQSGKSTAVRTVVTALAATHTPERVQMYCLDFGGGGLSALTALPHVGAVAGRADTDLVRRTIAELTTVVRKREAAFRRLGIESIADYRSRRATGHPSIADDGFGDVFLIVDGWATLRDDFEMLEAPVTALATRGLSYGVHVVLTASRWAEIRPALKDQIGTRIELRLSDAGESELNRRAAQHVPFGRPGHGITWDGMHMLVGLPRLDGKHESTGLSVAIADAAAGIRARFGDRVAPAVRLLPHRVDHAALIAGRPPGQMILGVEEDELAPVAIDFTDYQHILILGEGECGKTAALRLICKELVRTRSAEQAQLMIVDYRRTLLGVVESDHLAGYAVSGAVLAAQLPALVDRLRARIPGPDVDQHHLRTRSWWSGPDVYLIVDDYDLISTDTAAPLPQIIELLPHAKDLGLHVVVARRSGGAGRALFEPLLARLRELGCLGVTMSASPDEGVLLGAMRVGPLPRGRARLINRAGERVVQLGWIPPSP
ncbi:MAG TPA: type VII secretion protein EccCb, partial [Mycobacterium sp.]|nr:type VII secretion protein EccCb [Mycobacterium sp.]